MSVRSGLIRTAVAAAAFAAFACSDTPSPSGPSASDLSTSSERSAVAQDRLAALFGETSREIMGMPHTVMADYDESLGKLVFGVSNANAAAGIQRSLVARGLSADDFVIREMEPVVNLAALTDQIRPTQGGTQINFPGYLCTLGFNIDQGGARSFITNSHCTTTQGGEEGTTYGQPLQSNGGVIATEADDPGYAGGGSCSAGKICRRSDASRALYAAGVPTSRGLIAKTTGVNTGSLTTAGSFVITSQDDANNSFAIGTVIHKVGRTTGWTQGTVSSTCATVNVSQSNIQLHCQTMVASPSRRTAIVGSGDSGSSAFTITSGDNVKLVGILWGGSGSTTFVFSPLKNVQEELNSFNALTDGSGGGGGGGTTPPPCVPVGNSGKCK